MMELCNIAVRCDKIESELDRKMDKMDCKLNKVKMEVDNHLVTITKTILVIFLQKSQKSFKVTKVSGVML